MKIYLPNNLDLKKHINTFIPDEFNLINFKIDKAVYILGLITSIPATNKEILEKVELNGGYVPLCSVALQFVVHDYKKYLNYFILTGILETDNIYISTSISIEKAKCYGYKFTDKFNSAKREDYDYYEGFDKKLVSNQARYMRSNKSEYSHLIKWFWPKFDLEINSDLAYKFLKNRKKAQELDSNLIDKTRIKGTNIIRTKDPEIQYIIAKYNVLQIKRKELYFKVDTEVNRLHTNITNFNSELRNLLTYKGETLYSIDIVNSQPYLTLSLFNNNLDKIIKDNKYINQILPMLEEFNQKTDNQDFKLFVDLVSSSVQADDLYTYIWKQSENFDIEYKSRSSVKTGMFEVLFSKNGYKTKSKKLFERLFPTINNLYVNIKENDNSQLACLLQSIEAHIILRVITKKIAKRFPNAPLFTIHDSIATTEQYKDYVEKQMILELSNLTNYAPKLKVEKWTPDQIDWQKYRVA